MFAGALWLIFMEIKLHGDDEGLGAPSELQEHNGNRRAD